MTIPSGADGMEPRVFPWRAALLCRCPRCGQGKLFDGLLTIVSRCAVCDLDFSGEDVGDGPVALIVLLLGAIVVAGAICLEIAISPPAWVHIVVWTPVTILVSIALLRVFKAGLVAMQYRTHALGGPGA